MGFVKIELPFTGMKCDDCMYQSDYGYEENMSYCDLFDQWKQPYHRCVNCVEAELRSK